MIRTLKKTKKSRKSANREDIEMLKSTLKKSVFILLLILQIFIIVIFAALIKRRNNMLKYDKVQKYMQTEDYDKAFRILKELKYEDSDALEIYAEGKLLLKNSQYIEAINKFSILGDFQDSKEQILLAKYELGIELLDENDYDAAKQIFLELGDYKESLFYIETIEKEQLVLLTENMYYGACSLFQDKDYEKALEKFNLILGYKDSNKKAEICKRHLMSHRISCGILNSFGISEKGEVLIAGSNLVNQCKVETWENIVSIDCYGECTVGLTEEGRVKGAGNISKEDQVIISGWEKIIDVSSGDLHVAVLKNDGTVDAVGHKADGQCDVKSWRNVVDIDCGWRFTVGLTQEGNLLYTGIVPNKMEEDYLATKDDWKNVVKIVASGGDPERDDRGKGHVVGLTSDGRVIAIGDNSKGQCEVYGEEWKNIVAIAAGDWYTVALTQEGKVLITGENVSGSKYIDYEKLNAWEDIQDIAAGYGQTLVVMSNGYVDTMGFDDYDKCSDTLNWTEKIKQ